MVAIQPFCALRYNPGLIEDLSGVLAPPYDVIDAEEQEQLYRASPYNIVRLLLGKQFPSDTEEDNRYTRAQRDFHAWRQRQILLADPLPALYVVEHTFHETGRSRSRLGFIGLLQLSDSLGRDVYRHEVTLAEPRQDRTKLLEALPANLSPIFCVYPDQGARMQAMLKELTQQTPPTSHASLRDERIRLWAITDEGVIQEVTRRLASVAVLIADGHHRFEVAYAKRARYGALMSYFVSMEDPSLLVRPIHRIIRHHGAADPQALRGLCELEPVNDVGSLMRWLQEDAGQGRFGYANENVLYRATVNPAQVARWLIAPSVPLPVAALDVSLLHGLILPRLGVSPARTPASGGVNGTGVHYTAEASEAIQIVRGAPGCSAWLLRGIPLQQVYTLAAQGLTLPPKSTYFYPKVPSGLTIHPLS